VIEVPGALEVPSAIATAARMADFDGFVALGCIIRGETTHYDTVCNDSSRGLMLLGLEGVAVGNGILTVENRDQAVVRADPARQNKGGGAAAAALHLVALSRKWAGQTKGIGFLPLDETIRIAQDDKGPTRA
jgi:6,7-dimethyl-8-ribityllumazine synthase